MSAVLTALKPDQSAFRWASRLLAGAGGLYAASILFKNPALEPAVVLCLAAAVSMNSWNGRFRRAGIVGLAPACAGIFLAMLSAIYNVEDSPYAALLTMPLLDMAIMFFLAGHLMMQAPLRWPVNVLTASYTSLKLSRYYLLVFSILPVALGGLILFMQELGHADAHLAAVLYVFTSVTLFSLVLLKGATWAHRLSLIRDLAVKRLEESWKSREAYFRNLVDDSPVILYLSGEKGGCTFLSKKWQEYTGRPVTQDLGFGWIECVHPEDRAYIADVAQRGKMERYEGFSHEYRLRRWDGEYRWVITTGFPRFDDKHNFIGYLGNVIDVHDRKIQEDSLKKEKQNAEISSQTKSQFLANMSHEIRTPLNAILGFSDLCGDPGCTRGERVDYLKRIRANGDHLLRLIDDILDLAKMESGAGVVQKSLFSVERLMDEIVASLRALAAQKGLELEVKHSGALPSLVYSDPHRIKQVVNNLVGNAIKFTAAGKVAVELAQAGEQIAISIRDTGIGLSQEQKDNLFKPFSQGDSSVTRKFGGTGLGLHLSRKLAQSIGGDVQLKSSGLGQGSEFEFTFFIGTEDERRPVVAPRRRQAVLPPSEPLPANMLYGRKILVAEDSADGKELIHLYFRSTGVQLLYAEDGFEAYDKALREKPELILMDVQMPGMDGLEATRRLRHAGFKSPIVALTAHALQDEVDRSFEAGCNYHLTKPVMKDVLLALVGELLQHAPVPNR